MTLVYMTYRRRLHIFAIIKGNHFKAIVCVCFSHDTKHVHFEVISFYNSKDIYNISKTKQGNQKLKDNLLCYFKYSFK